MSDYLVRGRTLTSYSTFYLIPFVLNLQDSSIPQLTLLTRNRHGTEGSATHIKMNRF